MRRFARWVLRFELQAKDEAISTLLHALIHVTEPEQPKAPGPVKPIKLGRMTFAQQQADWEWNHNKRGQEAIALLKLAQPK